MEYVVYRRFKAEGIDGAFNLRYGTTVTERDGFLFAAALFGKNILIKFYM